MEAEKKKLIGQSKSEKKQTKDKSFLSSWKEVFLFLISSFSSFIFLRSVPIRCSLHLERAENQVRTQKGMNPLRVSLTSTFKLFLAIRMIRTEFFRCAETLMFSFMNVLFPTRFNLALQSGVIPLQVNKTLLKVFEEKESVLGLTFSFVCCCLAMAGEFARKANVKNLVLTHFSPRFVCEQKEHLSRIKLTWFFFALAQRRCCEYWTTATSCAGRANRSTLRKLRRVNECRLDGCFVANRRAACQARSPSLWR